MNLSTVSHPLLCSHLSIGQTAACAALHQCSTACVALPMAHGARCHDPFRHSLAIYICNLMLCSWPTTAGQGHLRHRDGLP
jgi:hypothetical protein